MSGRSSLGTLYRHFPAKADLVGAIVDELSAEVTRGLDTAAARVERQGGALAEVRRFLQRIAVEMGPERALRDFAVRSSGYSTRDVEERSRSALARILRVGHREGTVAGDVSVDDLALLTSTVPASDAPEPVRRRWVELAVRSLAPPGGSENEGR